MHTISYYGVLAPAASKRDLIVPGHNDPPERFACRHARADKYLAVSADQP